MKRLAVIGAGDLGRLIAHYAALSGQFTLAGFFDDFLAPGERVESTIVCGPIQHIERIYAERQFDEIIIGVGYKHFGVRKQLYERLSKKVPFAKVIHPSSYVDQTCRVGSGTVILPGCVLDRNVVVADNVFLNVGCAAAHDTTIGAHSFLGPRVSIAGASNVKECCFLGVGATITNHVSLCTGAIIGAGAVVVKDVTQPGKYVGCPAKLI